MSRASGPWQTIVFEKDNCNKIVTKINMEQPVSLDTNPTETVASPFH